MKMCGAKLQMMARHRTPDRMLLDGTIVPGKETTTWRTCGKKPGHKGPHGSWSRWRRWRWKLRLP